MAGDLCRSPGYSQLFSERAENLKRITCGWWQGGRSGSDSSATFQRHE